VRVKRRTGVEPKSAAPATKARRTSASVSVNTGWLGEPRGSPAARLSARICSAGNSTRVVRSASDRCGVGLSARSPAKPTSDPSRAAPTICSIDAPCAASQSSSSRRSEAFGACGS
jgi:hypothetical protein